MEKLIKGKNDINNDGTFDYQFFDKYFTDYDREAYLVNYKNICEVVLGKELC